ncbi:MAG: dihydropteroate synthase [Pseudohongiellaceae bacterium]|nr:dihydropteroate synthase [Pseudohongiellaceae bacterium]
MGILNVTPDSFSDGGRLYVGAGSRKKVDVAAALEVASKMCEDGAAILDIGGESTRPGAQKVSEQEELDRVLPLVEAIAGSLDVGISVDTSNPRVMEEALGLGAGLINDVRALSREGTVSLLANTDAAICLMHMRGQPSTMQQSPDYESVVDEVYSYLSERVQACLEAGIERSRLIVDPGFGFGKSLAHNYQLLRELDRFAALGLPILVGISRKSMIGGVCGREVSERLAGTLSATVHALEGGAAIIRAHDVAATIDAIKVHCAVKGFEQIGKV